jgi:hypothetical protein
VGISQVGKLFQDGTENSVRPDNIQKSLKRSMGASFPFVQCATELNSKPINTIDLQQFRKVIRHFDRKGNSVAQNMMDMLIDVSLENVFNDAFGITNTPENNQKIANETLHQKLDEIYNNSELNDNQKARKRRMIINEFELEKDRIEEEKEQYMKSDANKKKFIDDLRQIINDEWEFKTEEIEDEDIQKVLKDTIEFYNVFKKLKFNQLNRDNFYNTNVFVSKFVDIQFLRGQHNTLGRFAKRICEDYNIPYNPKGTKNNEDSEVSLSQNEYPFELLEYLSKQITPKGNKYQSIKNSLKVVIEEIEKLYSDWKELPVSEEDFDFLTD